MKDCSLFSSEVYFSAANGYGGFRSYFDTVFKSDDFDKLFILKGGPGTGKSSLIRNVMEYFHSRGCICEAILCSSDTDSLDGAIIENGAHRVGIIDGTAPHARDATVPGAIDEIVNLGENWNSIALEKEREIISNFGEKKRKSYKNAYNYLRIAGFFAFENEELYRKRFNFAKAEKSVDLILKSISTRGFGKKSVKLKDAFGRNGKESLGYEFDKSTLRIGGCEECAVLFMNSVLKRLKEKDISYTRYPSVSSDDVTLAIETYDFAIAVDSKKCEICADDFATPLCNEERALSESFKENVLSFEKKSTDCFKEASNNHFKLEEIYKSSMDFSLNSLKERKIISCCERFLLQSKTN